MPEQLQSQLSGVPQEPRCDLGFTLVACLQPTSLAVSTATTVPVELNRRGSARSTASAAVKEGRTASSTWLARACLATLASPTANARSDLSWLRSASLQEHSPGRASTGWLQAPEERHYRCRISVRQEHRTRVARRQGCQQSQTTGTLPSDDASEREQWLAMYMGENVCGRAARKVIHSPLGK